MAETNETETAPSPFVLLEWTGVGAKHIATEIGNAFLIPKSVTRVARGIWEIAREWHLDLIVPASQILTDTEKNLGRIIEHAIKVTTENVPEVKGPGGKIVTPARKVSKIVDAKDLKDLQDSEARALLSKIVDPAVLKGYLEDPELDGKDALKGAIDRRLKEVGEKGSKKGKE